MLLFRGVGTWMKGCSAAISLRDRNTIFCLDFHEAADTIVENCDSTIFSEILIYFYGTEVRYRGIQCALVSLFELRRHLL